MGEYSHDRPSWVIKTFKDSRLLVLQKFTPAELVNMGRQVTLPIEQDEAEELYDRFNTHFKAWTGKDLKNFK